VLRRSNAGMLVCPWHLRRRHTQTRHGVFSGTAESGSGRLPGRHAGSYGAGIIRTCVRSSLLHTNPVMGQTFLQYWPP
jgi:hypothetical protein